MIKVLIVEDDPAITELNKQHLGMLANFELVAIIKNSTEVLDYLNKNEVGLILLDVFMPQMDGFSLLKEIQVKHPNIAVIMITATYDSSDIKTALNLGIIDYLVKPFTFDSFKSTLLTFREKLRILSVDKELDQSTLEQLFLYNKNTNSIINKLPKGIDPATLEKVECLLKKQEGEFSINELLTKVPLSRISLKKYIDYLHNDLQVLGSRLKHLSVGRPVRIYQYKSQDKK